MVSLFNFSSIFFDKYSAVSFDSVNIISFESFSILFSFKLSKKFSNFTSFSPKLSILLNISFKIFKSDSKSFLNSSLNSSDKYSSISPFDIKSNKISSSSSNNKSYTLYFLLI